MPDQYSELPFLKDNISTLKECSKTDQGIPMNVPSLPCINFDAATNDLSRFYGGDVKSASSADSFVLMESEQETPVLIEFKSGIVNSKERKNVREKMCNSILTLEAILNQKWTDLRKTMVFILVYKKEKNRQTLKDSPKEIMHNHLINKAAGTAGVRFNLGSYQNIYYKKVLTLTEEEFTAYCTNNLH